MSTWNKFVSNTALFGAKEVGKKSKRKRVPRAKADSSGPGVLKKKYNPRPKKAEVRSIDPTGYVPQEKVKHTPGELFKAQVDAPVLPKRINKR